MGERRKALTRGPRMSKKPRERERIRRCWAACQLLGQARQAELNGLDPSTTEEGALGI